MLSSARLSLSILLLCPREKEGGGVGWKRGSGMILTCWADLCRCVELRCGMIQYDMMWKSSGTVREGGRMVLGETVRRTLGLLYLGYGSACGAGL